MSGTGQSNTPPLVEVSHATSLTLNLDEHCETGMTMGGINFTAEGRDGYVLSPAQAREIGEALIAASEEVRR